MIRNHTHDILYALLVAALILLATLCSVPAFGDEPPGVGRYVQRFQDAIVDHVGAKLPQRLLKRFRFILSPLPDGSDAMCRRDDRVIIIDPLTWFTASDSYRELLVFHELGHCLLSMDHTQDGIMAPSANVFSARTYRLMRESYLRSFFRPLKDSLGFKEEAR